MIETIATNNGAAEAGGSPEMRLLDVIEGVDFNPSMNLYPAPFARREEVDGFLSGSEHWTLCSSGESIYSHSFVQCNAALIRNRQTGKIQLIHESTWSGSATVALGTQRSEDIDVITIVGPSGTILFRDIQYFHEKDPEETIAWIDGINESASKRFSDDEPGNEDRVSLFLDSSALLGVSRADLKQATARLKSNSIVGDTHHFGRIQIPVSRGKVNRWYLLYRPFENVIWIYESGTKQLFKYCGFETTSSN